MLTRIAILVVLVGSLAGCGSFPLLPVEYAAPASITSQIPFQLHLNTGRVGGYGTSTLVTAGGVFIPVRSGPQPALHFGVRDQEIFSDFLGSELVRLGILKAPVATESAEPLDIYAYEVLSSEGDSVWTKMTTNASQGKQKAASKLLARMVPDIESFVVQILRGEDGRHEGSTYSWQDDTGAAGALARRERSRCATQAETATDPARGCRAR